MTGLNKRAILVGAALCATFAIAIAVAMAWFGTSRVLTDDETKMLRLALTDIRPPLINTGGQTDLCILNKTMSYDRVVYMMGEDRAFDIYMAKFRRDSDQEPNPLPLKSVPADYHVAKVKLLDLTNFRPIETDAVLIEGRRDFLTSVRSPYGAWSRCDGVVEVSTPVIKGNAAFVAFEHIEGVLGVGSCYRQVVHLAYNYTNRIGQFTPGWKVVGRNAEMCMPVY